MWQKGKDHPNYKHGNSKHPIYHVWNLMKGRCFNKRDNSYPTYGGRGITVCDRWLMFENFVADMYGSYLEHREKVNYEPFQTQLDRIDGSKGYSPDNCRWLTRKENLENRGKTNNDKP